MNMNTTKSNRLRKEGGNYGPTGMENQDLRVACPTGIEPVTPSLEGWCSIRLSYGQIVPG
jgi:hypothetical protein